VMILLFLKCPVELQVNIPVKLRTGCPTGKAPGIAPLAAGMKALGSRVSIMVLASSSGRKMIRDIIIKENGKKVTSMDKAPWFLETQGFSKVNGDRAITWETDPKVLKSVGTAGSPGLFHN